MVALATMHDEPRRHPRFLSLLALTGLGSVPLPFLGREPVLVLGLPLWLLWSLGATVAMAALTTWGVLRLWKDDDGPPEESP